MHIPLSTKELYRHLSFTTYARIIAELHYAGGSYVYDSKAREIHRLVKLSKLKYPHAEVTDWVVAFGKFKDTNTTYDYFSNYEIADILKIHFGETITHIEVERIIKEQENEILFAR